MLLFVRPADAIRCSLGIVADVREVGLPPARAAITAGPLIVQDGDYFGRAVHRASRLLGIAAPEHVLVTDKIAASAGNGFQFVDVGTSN